MQPELGNEKKIKSNTTVKNKWQNRIQEPDGPGSCGEQRWCQHLGQHPGKQTAFLTVQPLWECHSKASWPRVHMTTCRLILEAAHGKGSIRRYTQALPEGQWGHRLKDSWRFPFTGIVSTLQVYCQTQLQHARAVLAQVYFGTNICHCLMCFPAANSTLILEKVLWNKNHRKLGICSWHIWHKNPQCIKKVLPCKYIKIYHQPQEHLQISCSTSFSINRGLVAETCKDNWEIRCWFVLFCFNAKGLDYYK